MNRFLAKEEQIEKQSKAYWRAKGHERQTAKRLGGKLVKGSGSGTEKGDVRIRGVARIECKTTGAKSFSVTASMMEKIENAAMSSDEVPAICVEFLSTLWFSKEVAVIPMWALQRLIDNQK